MVFASVTQGANPQIKQNAINTALLAFNHETANGATFFDGMAVDEFNDFSSVNLGQAVGDIGKIRFIWKETLTLANINAVKSGDYAGGWKTHTFSSPEYVTDIEFWAKWTGNNKNGAWGYAEYSEDGAIWVGIGKDYANNYHRNGFYCGNNAYEKLKISLNKKVKAVRTRAEGSQWYGTATAHTELFVRSFKQAHAPFFSESKTIAPKDSFREILAVICQEKITTGALFEFDISVDDGVTWTRTQLVEILDGNVKVYKAIANISGDIHSKIKWRVIADKGDDQYIHAVALMWG